MRVKPWNLFYWNKPTELAWSTFWNCDGTSSIHTTKSGILMAYLTKLWAKALHYLFVWEWRNSPKLCDNLFASSISKPSGTSIVSSSISPLITFKESPSKMARLTPTSSANERAQPAAIVSISLLQSCWCISFEQDAMTCPLWSLITTPTPVFFSSGKTAPSKLIL